MARTINGVPLSILFLLLALILIVIAMLIAVVRKKRDGSAFASRFSREANFFLLAVHKV